MLTMVFAKYVAPIIAICFSSQLVVLIKYSLSAIDSDPSDLAPPLIPQAIIAPSQEPNYTLGFLQNICQNDSYPLTESCFYYPTDLWPDTPEFAPYKSGNRPIHWQDFLNDEFNGVSWCPNITGFNSTTGSIDPGYEFNAPCIWHHHIALTSFAQCMLTKMGITYFLDTGGLIGSLRNGGFELTDHDVDFAVWIPDEMAMSQLKRIPAESRALVKASNNVPSNVKISVALNARVHVNVLSSIHGKGIGHVDIWRFNVTEGNHSTVHPPAFWTKGSDGIDKENLFPLGQCNYMGKIVPCPRRPYPYLKQRFQRRPTNFFVSPGTDLYTPKASFAGANRSMNCLEAGGSPTLRKGSETKQFFAHDDPRGHPPLSE